MKRKADLLWIAESLLKPSKGLIVKDMNGTPMIDANRRELLDRVNDLDGMVYGKNFALVAYERVRTR